MQFVVGDLKTSGHLDIWPRKLKNLLTLGNCLFEAVKTKSYNKCKYRYIGHSTRFDSRSFFRCKF